MNKQITQLIAASLVAVFISAGLALAQRPALAAGTEEATQSDPMQFARGAQTWANTCARCHNMRDPKELRDDQWRTAVAHMRVRAGLTGQEARDVLVFLQGSN
jgi:cytochrome c1